MLLGAFCPVLPEMCPPHRSHAPLSSQSHGPAPSGMLTPAELHTAEGVTPLLGIWGPLRRQGFCSYIPPLTDSVVGQRSVTSVIGCGLVSSGNRSEPRLVPGLSLRPYNNPTLTLQMGTEIQRGCVTCPRQHRKYVAEQDGKPARLGAQALTTAPGEGAHPGGGAWEQSWCVTAPSSEVTREGHSQARGSRPSLTSPSWMFSLRQWGCLSASW